MGKLADKISEFGEEQKPKEIETAIDRYNKEYKKRKKKKKKHLFDKLKSLLSGKSK